MSEFLRVLMLEDSEADADLITSVLRKAGLEIIAERVDSSRAFIDAVREFAPDVVLSDHAVPAFSVRAALDVLREAHPSAPLIVVTGALDEREVVACVRAGADTIVLKSNLGRLPRSIADALTVRRRLDTLSPRQLQVLRLVAEGHSTPDIAERLELSHKTVETHRGEVMKRLNIHDVVGLVRYAVRVGLVSQAD